MDNRHISLRLPLLSLFACAILPEAMAQLDQTISVEGKYTPEIIRLDRINAFPKQERFSLETSPLAYDATGIPAAFAPKIYSMPATGWKDSRKVSSARGYLELGAGSQLNSTLSAGYRFIQDSRSLFGIRLQHNSTSLWKPEISAALPDTRQWRYDEAIGLYGSHIFEGSGRLDAAVDYHIGNFNYYAFNPFGADPALWQQNGMKAPTQTLNDISGRIGWQSISSSEDDIAWRIAAGARYFGYRRIYIPGSYQSPIAAYISPENFRSTRETDVNLNGGINFPLSSGSAVGLDMNADLLLYTGFKNEPYVGGEPLWQAPDSYFLMTLTPYYRFSIDRLNLRLGVDLDIASGAKGAGSEGEKYGTIHVAPDVMLDYDAGAARFFLHLTGGSRLHTLASGSELNYYQQPFILDTRPVYSPLDGELGVSFGPFSGFSAGLRFAYRISRGEYLGGWYQELLNGNPYASLPESVNGFPASYSFLDDESCNLHGYSIGADISYDFGKAFKISASGSYQPQKEENGYFNGLDRPRWIADISAQTNPWNTLKLTLSYGYRGVRRAFTKGTFHNDKGFDEDFTTYRRLADVTSLNFGASYSFTDAFALWIQADNLLNRKIETLPGLPSQGISVAGGLSVVF